MASLTVPLDRVRPSSLPLTRMPRDRTPLHNGILGQASEVVRILELEVREVQGEVKAETVGSLHSTAHRQAMVVAEVVVAEVAAADRQDRDHQGHRIHGTLLLICRQVTCFCGVSLP